MIEKFEVLPDGSEAPLPIKFDGTKRVRIKAFGQTIISKRATAKELQADAEYLDANSGWIQSVIKATGKPVKFAQVPSWMFSTDKIHCMVLNNTAYLNSGPAIEEDAITQEILKQYEPNIMKWISACRKAGLLQALFQTVEFSGFSAKFAAVKHNTHMFEFFVIQASSPKAGFQMELLKDGNPCELDDPDIEGALAKTLLFKDLGV